MRILLVALIAAAVAASAFPAMAQQPKPAPAAPAAAAAMPAVGAPAPTFRLNDHEGRMTAIGGARSDGKWTVIAFYPKAATPGCTKEVCSLRDAAAQFAEKNVLAFAISLGELSRASALIVATRRSS